MVYMKGFYYGLYETLDDDKFKLQWSENGLKALCEGKITLKCLLERMDEANKEMGEAYRFHIDFNPFDEVNNKWFEIRLVQVL